jgi:ADP-ribose pyrophosphatase YjhB (NUDIX family)
MLRFGAFLVQATIAQARIASAAAPHTGRIVMDTKLPALTVDCVVFDPDGRLLLIRRKNPPFRGQYALPGGYVDYGETTEHAAARELAEETSLAAVTMSLIGVFSDPHRDPRGHTVSIAYRVGVANYGVQPVS